MTGLLICAGNGSLPGIAPWGRTLGGTLVTGARTTDVLCSSPLMGGRPDTVPVAVLGGAPLVGGAPAVATEATGATTVAPGLETAGPVTNANG